MRAILFALTALVALWFLFVGASILRVAGNTGALEVDILIGATTLAAGVLLAALAYIYRPE